MAAYKTRLFHSAVAGMTLAAMTGLALPSAQAQPVTTPAAAPSSPPQGAPLSFADIFDRVSPAVVSINVTATVDRRALQGLPGFQANPSTPKRGAPKSPTRE